MIGLMSTIDGMITKAKSLGKVDPNIYYDHQVRRKMYEITINCLGKKYFFTIFCLKKVADETKC